MALYKKGSHGNEKIRSSGVPVEWDEFKVQEFKKCLDDPEYFISNYVRILNLDSEQLVLFKPRPYQINMINAVMENRFVISKWGRQMGKSVVVSAIILWLIIFNSNYPVLILAHKHDKAREILAVIQQMYENLPEWLQHGVKTWNKGSIELENGSLIKTAGTSSSSGRGGSFSTIFLDEMAFIPSHIADEFLKSVVPTISSGKDTKIIITSTPKGLNSFYRIWMDSINEKNEFVRVDVNWYEAPGRDEAFKQKTIEAYGLDYWRQEFESAFIGSSKTLISADKLTSIATLNPVRQSDTAKIYFEPEEGHTYAVTVDVSEGLGEDYSVVMVFDATQLPYQVVAIYRNNLIEPMALPSVIHEMAVNYNNALVLIESNFGQQIGEILYNEFEYENMVFTTKGKSGPSAKMDKISGGHSQRSRVGLQMNAQSKRIGCSNLKSLIENDQLFINDVDILEELMRFSVNKKSYAAESGNDDLVMAMVLFAWMADQGYVRDATDVNLRVKIAELNERRIEDDMLPLGFRHTGLDEEFEPIDLASDFNPIDIPYGHETHRWSDLFSTERSRGGLTEAQLHDQFMRDMFEGPKVTEE